jgi:hypothetical protein
MKKNYRSPEGNNTNTIDPILDQPLCGEGDPEAITTEGNRGNAHTCGEAPGHDGPHCCYNFHSCLQYNNICLRKWGHEHDTKVYRPCHCMKDESDRFCRTCRDTGRIEATPEQAEVYARLYKECYTGHQTEEWWWKLTDWVIADRKKNCDAQIKTKAT